ncbi:zinc-finger homeodomain protein 8-like [Wolffia australiana]
MDLQIERSPPLKPTPITEASPLSSSFNGDSVNHAVYKQCMKNHAAAIGGHAVDGCGEFLPSAVPSSYACAACGCHRNFHRRVLPIVNDHRQPPLLPSTRQKKRARTKFTEEQKLSMKELSEKLGWRMQKGDAAMVEIACRDMGVDQSVFKVWMHNNKHIFVQGSSSRRAGGGGKETSPSSNS